MESIMSLAQAREQYTNPTEAVAVMIHNPIDQRLLMVEKARGFSKGLVEFVVLFLER